MYRKGLQGWRKHFDFMIVDIISLQLSFWATYVIRYGNINPYINKMYRNLAIAMTVIDIIVIILFEVLKNVLKRGYYKEIVATFKHVCLVILVTIFYLFTIQNSVEYSRIFIYLFGCIYLVFSVIMRLLWKKWLKYVKIIEPTRSILLITTSKIAEEVVAGVQDNNYEPIKISGIVLMDKEQYGESISSIPVVSGAANVLDYVCHEWVDEVFIYLPQEDRYPAALVERFLEMGITVHINVHMNKGDKDIVERMGSYTVVTKSISYATTLQSFMKRTMDIIGGIVGCLITILLIIIIGPLIYIQSPGPIFFSQIRVGKNGRKFKIYKFRSMYLDAEERKKDLLDLNRVSGNLMFKLDWDPRIIGSKKLPDGTTKRGIGNIIRDFSLDEFPQFYNVLKGEMSLVGTRPPTVEEWNKYELHHRARLAAKPGITGMWQVSGRSNITNFEDVVKLDMEYITGWSMALDLRILAKTVVEVLNRKGAM